MGDGRRGWRGRSGGLSITALLLPGKVNQVVLIPANFDGGSSNQISFAIPGPAELRFYPERKHKQAFAFLTFFSRS